MQEYELIQETEAIICEFEKFLKGSKQFNKYIPMINSLKSELTSPCVLAITGKVKAGKSSLLNALLGVDLAITGTTETTATINVFKSGNPIDPEKPILCHYLDGSKAWHPKSYLDRLQGTSEQALAETSKIDKLVFYIPNNSILDSVTIVDTPGIGASVGEDGDSHQVQTDSYFKLKERHRSETTNISNSADAVIYLFDTVPTEIDKTFLDALYDGGNGLTAFNGVGVLSKIDRDLSMIENVPKFKAEFDKQLFTIVPTSSAIYNYIPGIKTAIRLKEQFTNGFESPAAFKQAIMSEFAFLHPNLPKCSLSIEERSSIISLFKDRDFQWSTFKIIADRIYNAVNVQEELDELKQISGIDALKIYISDHFFKRAKLLRCHKVLSELRAIMSSIIYSKDFIDNEQRAGIKGHCLSACTYLPTNIKTILIQLINDNIPSVESIVSTKKKIAALKQRIDEAKLELTALSNSAVVYQRILAEPEQFSNSEIIELEKLFSGKGAEYNQLQRIKYWSAVYNSSKPNSIRQNASMTAKQIYQTLLR